MSRWILLVLLSGLLLSGCARPETYQGGCAAVRPEGSGGGITVTKPGSEPSRTVVHETWDDGDARTTEGPYGDATFHFCQQYGRMPSSVRIQVLDVERDLLAMGSWSLSECPPGTTWFDLQVAYDGGHLDPQTFDCGVDDPPWLRPGPPVT